MSEYSYSGWHLQLRKGDTNKEKYLSFCIKNTFMFLIYMQNRLELQWKPEIINWHTYFLETEVLQMSDSPQIKGTFLWVCFYLGLFSSQVLYSPRTLASWEPWKSFTSYSSLMAMWAFNQSSWLKMCEPECWFALADKQPALLKCLSLLICSVTMTVIVEGSFW